MAIHIHRKIYKKMLEQFGAQPSDSDIERYSHSEHWNGEIFVNDEPTKIDVNFFTLPQMLYKQFLNRGTRQPSVPLPLIPFDKDRFLSSGEAFSAVWFGHSAILMRVANTTIFIDPMLGPNAAPISPFPERRFSENTLDLIDALPELDLVLLSHDHYDHLDYDSVQGLKDKAKNIFTALGVGRHLRKWGIDDGKITEFDWWEDRVFNDIKITFTPSRHFSGRGPNDRAKSFWGGWVLNTGKENIWFSGDGGYAGHFKEIGKRLGPFDLGFVECGQYSDLWHDIHMYPEESVQAALDAGVRKAMPVHWGAFALSQHPWTEPPERWVAEADKKELDYIMPSLGETIKLDSGMRREWWRDGLHSK
jgi:L-ascorbate metabolism protein UlaG (beta-lactamase superfamily)